MDSLQQMNERARAARDDDVLLGMFFERVLDRVRETVNEASAQKLRAETVGGKKFTAFFRYPVTDYLKLLGGAASEQSRALSIPWNQAVEEVARSQVSTLFESALGRTLLMMTGSDPQRLLTAAPGGYKSVVSFGERSYEKTGPRSGVLRYRRELLGPSFSQALNHQAITSACKVDLRVETKVLDSSGLDFDLLVSW
jgi:uncharacterized protein (TIGR02265 family)